MGKIVQYAVSIATVFAPCPIGSTLPASSTPRTANWLMHMKGNVNENDPEDPFCVATLLHEPLGS